MKYSPLIVVIPGLLMTAAGCVYAEEFPQDLMGSASILKKGDVQVSANAAGAGLRLDFLSGANPSIQFKPETPWDLSGSPGLSFVVQNTGTESITLLIRMRNGDPSNEKGPLCSAVAAIPAGAKRELTIDFQKEFPQPGQVGGRIPEAGPTLYKRGGKFNFVAVTSLTFGIDAWAPKASIVLSDVKLVPVGTAISAPPAVKGIVDKYGQFAWADWSGKLHEDADFAAQIKAEEADLKANPQLANRSRYGGWSAGPKLQATGFFYAAKYQDKWTLVDPDGYLFLSIGLNRVSAYAESPLDSRKDLYSWLPDAKDPMAFTRYTKTEADGKVSDVSIDFSRANLYRKYGADWEKKWADVTQRRLPSWGFNTIANWSAGRFQGDSKVPYVATIHIPKKYAWLGSMMDPWDPQFAASAAEVIAPAAAKVKADAYCMGYFVDNEMPWAYDFDIALAALKLDGSKSPGKTAFVEQLKAKYGTVEALNAAWGSQLASWEVLAAPFTAPKENQAKMKEDLSAFCKAHGLKYFTVVRDTLKVNDPNHLYLGCRFSHSTGEAYNAAVEVCDVVSFNVYEQQIGGNWGWLSDKKPTIIGEFHFGALDRGMFRVGLQGAGSQDGRARLFEKYVDSVVKNPKFVGCHWFIYNDQPLLGRPGDGENYNVGFLSVADRPYPEMVGASRRTLAGMYEKRWGK